MEWSQTTNFDLNEHGLLPLLLLETGMYNLPVLGNREYTQTKSEIRENGWIYNYKGHFMGGQT